MLVTFTCIIKGHFTILLILTVPLFCMMVAGGPGLSDPCEKEPVDVFGKLNIQSRENLTAYAQVSLITLCAETLASKKFHILKFIR